MRGPGTAYKVRVNVYEMQHVGSRGRVRSEGLAHEPCSASSASRGLTPAMEIIIPINVDGWLSRLHFKCLAICAVRRHLGWRNVGRDLLFSPNSY